MKLRGAGDFIGTAQTINNKYVILMLAYPKFNAQIKNEVFKVYSDEKKAEYV